MAHGVLEGATVIESGIINRTFNGADLLLNVTIFLAENGTTFCRTVYNRLIDGAWIPYSSSISLLVNGTLAPTFPAYTTSITPSHTTTVTPTSSPGMSQYDVSNDTASYEAAEAGYGALGTVLTVAGTAGATVVGVAAVGTALYLLGIPRAGFAVGRGLRNCSRALCNYIGWGNNEGSSQDAADGGAQTPTNVAVADTGVSNYRDNRINGNEFSTQRRMPYSEREGGLYNT